MTGAKHPAAKHEFEGLLADLERLSESGEPVSLNAVVNGLGARGYGPLLLILSSLLLLPTGMVPGMPAIVAILQAGIALQMLRGERGLLVPRVLGRMHLSGRLIQGSVRRAKPIARRISRVLHPRLTFWATARPVLWTIALLLIGSAAVMLVIGFIPGLPFVLAAQVFLFALGLTARDGLFVIAGLFTTLPAVALVLWLV